ncbi:helix-turn-helix domain-containing protein [Actinoplanes sp. M2I2]|uniref:helix-turn-helix domain-containing protein n=1 Tax=Actinoplanes sp. M2I2 TaxID=1734444 RepID=UPI0035B0F7F9
MVDPPVAGPGIETRDVCGRAESSAPGTDRPGDTVPLILKSGRALCWANSSGRRVRGQPDPATHPRRHGRRQTQRQLRGKQPKLPESAQRSIRSRYAEGDLSRADLAEEYSVGRSTIHRIIHGDPAADSHPSDTTDSHEAGTSETQPHAL